MIPKPDWLPDATWLTDFWKCPEAARLRHELGWVPFREDEAPRSGQALHAGLKAWFAGKQSGVEAALAALRADWKEEPVEEEGLALFGPPQVVQRPLELFERIVCGYAERWPREQDRFQVLDNEGYEEQFIDRWGAGFWWCGRKDRRIRWEDGSESIQDTKSTALRIDEGYLEAYQLNAQTRGYLAMELCKGNTRCTSVYIDAVHVDTYKKRKTKSGFTVYGGTVEPGHFVRHGPISVDDWKLSEWARSVEAALRLREHFLTDYGPEARWEQRDSNCFRWGKPCSYWGVCNLHRDALPATLERDFMVRRWEPNPERAI